MTKKDIPNIISALRILIVVPIVLLLIDEHYTQALILFLLAGLSDGIDGYLAKRHQWTTRLGSILDPIADKLLLLSCYVALGWLGHIPFELVIAVIVRDVVILVGAFAYHRLIGQYELAPSWMSKINTFSQILLGLAVLMSLSLDLFPLQGTVIHTLVVIVFVTTAASGVDYLWTWGRRAWCIKSGCRR